MSEIKIKATVVRAAKVFTIDKRDDQETMVMLIAKVTAPKKWASDKNIAFYLAKNINRETEIFGLLPRFIAMATSEAGDEVIIKTASHTNSLLSEEFLTNRISSFYNQTTKLGDWDIDYE